MSDFAIRQMTKDDEPFIFRAWLEGFWPNFAGNVVMPKSDYLVTWHRVIERILADPATRTLVAHVEGHPDQLLGFACGCDHVAHWFYTKQPFRGLGIAGELIHQLDVRDHVFSHWNHSGALGHWRYDPTLLKEYGG